MRVVGIDQSYSGFAYCVDGVSKKKSFPLSKYHNEVHRLAEIRRWFTGWLKEQVALDYRNVDLVVMEGYANAAKHGREAAGELGAVVKLAVYDEWNGDLLIVPPTSLKKFVTGKGNAKKNEMLLGVYKQWGESFTDDNQADAYALEQFGKAYLRITGQSDEHEQPGYPKYQIEAIEKVRKAA